jgi:hypothetical protein
LAQFRGCAHRRLKFRSPHRYFTKHCGLSPAGTHAGSVVSVFRQKRWSLTKRSYVYPPVPSTTAPRDATRPAAWLQLIAVVEGRDCAITLVAAKDARRAKSGLIQRPSFTRRVTDTAAAIRREGPREAVSLPFGPGARVYSRSDRPFG